MDPYHVQAGVSSVAIKVRAGPPSTSVKILIFLTLPPSNQDFPSSYLGRP